MKNKEIMCLFNGTNAYNNEMRVIGCFPVYSKTPENEIALCAMGMDRVVTNSVHKFLLIIFSISIYTFFLRILFLFCQNGYDFNADTVVVHVAFVHAERHTLLLCEIFSIYHTSKKRNTNTRQRLMDMK